MPEQFGLELVHHQVAAVAVLGADRPGERVDDRAQQLPGLPGRRSAAFRRSMSRWIMQPVGDAARLGPAPARRSDRPRTGCRPCGSSAARPAAACPRPSRRAAGRAFPGSESGPRSMCSDRPMISSRAYPVSRQNASLTYSTARPGAVRGVGFEDRDRVVRVDDRRFEQPHPRVAGTGRERVGDRRGAGLRRGAGSRARRGRPRDRRGREQPSAPRRRARVQRRQAPPRRTSPRPRRPRPRPTRSTGSGFGAKGGPRLSSAVRPGRQSVRSSDGRRSGRVCDPDRYRTISSVRARFQTTRAGKTRTGCVLRISECSEHRRGIVRRPGVKFSRRREPARRTSG